MRSTHSETPGRIAKSFQEVATIKRRDGIGYKLYRHVRWSHSSFIFTHSFNPHVVSIEPTLPVRFCGNPRQTTATKDTLLPSKKEKEIRTRISKQQSRMY